MIRPTVRSLRLFVALAGLLVLVPLGASAQTAARKPPAYDPLTPGLTGTQRLESLVERVRLAQKDLKTMEARFVQRQESSLLVSAEESQGVFSFAAPDRVRWEYKSPNPISVVIQGNEMTTWYRDLNRADKVKVGRYSNQVFKYLGASGSLQTLLDYFRIGLTPPAKKGDPYRLRLVPKYQRISKKLKEMTLWIDSERFVPVKLRYVEADGDTTEYEFQDLKINSSLPGDRFVLKLPQGVETRVLDLEGGNSKTANGRPGHRGR
jgi:outer membrane lipoprotein carrier protein